MGLTLTAEYADAPEYDLGYGAFLNLRRDIAQAANAEFGAHYARIGETLVHPELADAYDKETDRLIRKHHIGARICSFLFQPDCDGYLTPFACKAVADVIADMDKDRAYGYAARARMSLAEFRGMLLECFKQRKRLIWY